MTKDIHLTLKSIKYSGTSIGNDIRVEIEAIGENFGENYKINRGSTRSLEEKIGVFTVDQSAFQIPATLRIIERDVVFNDIGSNTTKLRIDLSSSTPQKFTTRVTVLEKRWKKKKVSAYFDINLEVQVVDAIRYIQETDQGFLNVKDANFSDQSAPAFLKVRYNRREKERDYFTVLEGFYRGEEWSVIAEKSDFLSENPHTGPINMVYSISKQTLKVKNKTYKIKTHLLAPWESGTWDVEIPTYPHGKAKKYLDRASKALVWFHLSHDPKEERYIHVGEHTAGCLTIEEVERWDELYEILIKSRKGDSKSIGTVTAVD